MCVVGVSFLVGCAPIQKLTKSDEGVAKKKQASSESFEGMALVRHDFYAGKVMEAYRVAQAMTAKDKEYKQARLFLSKNINPARIRLLRHYKRIAKKSERAKKWDQAWVNYKQTAEFSAKPEVFNSNIRSMYLHREQLRLNVLLKQQRLEDHALLQGLTAYEPPKGVSKHDVVFLGFLKRHQQMLENRAKQSYTQANTYLKAKKIIGAYVLAESHLRLMPDSSEGEALLSKIQKVWLKGLIIPKTFKAKLKTRKQTNKKDATLKIVKQDVLMSKDDIQLLIQQKQWLKAKYATVIYQKHEGEGADALMQTIDTHMQQAAEQAFQQGGLAFQQEHIDQAVSLWDRALQLEPQNEEYLDAFMRALSLQERLHLLQDKK